MAFTFYGHWPLPIQTAKIFQALPRIATSASWVENATTELDKLMHFVAEDALEICVHRINAAGVNETYILPQLNVCQKTVLYVS